MVPNQRWLDNRKRALDYLADKFPESIGARKPLKVGIIEDIRSINDGEKPALMWFRRALAFHTSRKAYLKNLTVGQERVDLAGNFAGMVTEQEKENALSRLSKLQRKLKPKVKTGPAKIKPEADDFYNRPILKLTKSKDK